MTDNSIPEQFIYSWRIKNISMCVLKRDDFICSPWILVDSLENTKWRFQLYFGYLDLSFLCFLCRANENDGPAKIALSGNIGIVDADGNFRISNDPIMTRSIKRGGRLGTYFSLRRALFENRNLLFPNDTLTIQCRIRSHRPNRHVVTKCSAVTDIAIEKCSFQWNIRNFDLHHLLNKLYVSVPLTKALYVGFYLTGIGDDEGSVNVVIRNQNIRGIFVSLQASLLNVNGANVEFERIKGMSSRHNVLKSSLLMSKKQLFEERASYEKEGILTLRCEVTIADGKEETHVESLCSRDISADILSMKNTNDSNRRKDCISNVLEYSNYEEILRLYVTAVECQMMELKKECTYILKTKLSGENVCQVLSFANAIGDKDLKAKAEYYISTNFTEVFMSNEWKDFAKNCPSVASKIILSVTKNIM